MKLTKSLVSILVALMFAITLLPSDALACACCAEPGTYSIRTSKPGKFELDELKKIKFDSAELYMTEAGDDGIKGLSSIGENYKLKGLLQGKTWLFDFKDDKKNAGILNLSAPTSMVSFMVDQREKKEGDPILYKEWRFQYNVSQGTGIFKAGIAPATKYFLVLQGRGNMCWQAEDFTSWRLEVTGAKADYAFYGDLKPLS